MRIFINCIYALNKNTHARMLTKLRYRAHASKIKISHTKSPKRDNIYKLCLWMLD